MTDQTEALARIDASLTRVPDSDAVTLSKSDVRALRALIPEPPRPQDIPDDEREVIIDVIRKALDVQSGHIYPEFSVRQAEWVAAAIVSSEPWRNRHRGPIRPEGISDEMVTAAAQAIAFENHDEMDGVDWPYLWDAATVARAALEAAEAAR